MIDVTALLRGRPTTTLASAPATDASPAGEAGEFARALAAASPEIGASAGADTAPAGDAMPGTPAPPVADGGTVASTLPALAVAHGVRDSQPASHPLPVAAGLPAAQPSAGPAVPIAAVPANLANANANATPGLPAAQMPARAAQPHATPGLPGAQPPAHGAQAHASPGVPAAQPAEQVVDRAVAESAPAIDETAQQAIDTTTGMPAVTAPNPTAPALGAQAHATPGVPGARPPAHGARAHATPGVPAAQRPADFRAPNAPTPDDVRVEATVPADPSARQPAPLAPALSVPYPVVEPTAMPEPAVAEKGTAQPAESSTIVASPSSSQPMGAPASPVLTLTGAAGQAEVPAAGAQALFAAPPVPTETVPGELSSSFATRAPEVAPGAPITLPPATTHVASAVAGTPPAGRSLTRATSGLPAADADHRPGRVDRPGRGEGRGDVLELLRGRGNRRPVEPPLAVSAPGASLVERPATEAAPPMVATGNATVEQLVEMVLRQFGPGGRQHGLVARFEHPQLGRLSLIVKGKAGETIDAELVVHGEAAARVLRTAIEQLAAAGGLPNGLNLSVRSETDGAAQRFAARFAERAAERDVAAPSTASTRATTTTTRPAVRRGWLI